MTHRRALRRRHLAIAVAGLSAASFLTAGASASIRAEHANARETSTTLVTTPTRGNPAITRDLGRDIQTRQAFGLDSDARYVAALYAGLSAHTLNGYSTSYGALLTRAETKEMDLRQAMLSKNQPVTQAYFGHSRFSSDFVGDYMDNRTGLFTVAVTRPAATYAATLRQRLYLPQRSAVRVVPYAQSVLAGISQLVTRDVRWWSQHGVEISAVSTYNPIGDRVTIGTAAPLTRAQLRLFTAHYTRQRVAAMTFTNTGSIKPTASLPPIGDPCPQCAKDYTNSPPFRLGSEVDWSDGTFNYTCTSGLSGYVSGTVKSYYATTAAHCAPVGTRFYQHTNPYPNAVDRRQFANNAAGDVERMPLTAGTESNCEDSGVLSGCIVAVTSAEGLNGDHIGGAVCQDGAWSNLHCGTLQQIVTIIELGLTIPYQRQASFYCHEGDSGSAVWDDNSSGNVKAAGDLDAEASGGAPPCFYTQTYDVVHKLGLTAILTASS